VRLPFAPATPVYFLVGVISAMMTAQVFLATPDVAATAATVAAVAPQILTLRISPTPVPVGHRGITVVRAVMIVSCVVASIFFVGVPPVRISTIGARVRRSALSLY
jgi:hypothetical protein